ncbi:hypothetical protein EON83_17240 [bacterium]|nr:MAG: hypothetical protein EON83_17240 [bacterium]
MGAPTRLFHQVRLQLFDHPAPPATPPTALDLLSRSAWHGASVQNVTDAAYRPTRGDVRQFRFDNMRLVEEDIEALDDDVSAGKIPGLFPGYRLDCLDCYPEDWQDVPLPKEAEYLAKAKEQTQTQIDLLEQKIAQVKPPSAPSDTDKEALAALYAELDSLKTNGFLETIPGSTLWGDDATGVYRRLCAANVPFRRRSRFTLENRPFTLWLWRAKPRPNQQNFYLQIDLGARLRLWLGSNDEAKIYRKNELRDAATFEKYDTEWHELQSRKYLAPETVLAIQAQKDKIAQLRSDAKGLKRKLNDKEKAELKAAIKKVNEAIRDLKGQKGQTSRDEARIKELEAYLFRQIEPLELANAGDGLVDETFSLTFIDSGVGFVQITLDIGANSYTFEDRYLTSRRKEEWLWGAKGDKIEIRSSGGACAWRFGYVEVNKRDQLRMAPTYLGDLGPAPQLPVTRKLIQPDGTTITFDLNGTAKTGWYQAALNFTSDGKRFPMVFRASVQVLASPSPAPQLVWDSANFPTAVLKGTPSMDAERKGTVWQIEIYGTDGLDSLNLPNNIRHRIANVWVRSYDGQGTFAPWRRVLTGGIAVDDNLEQAKALASPGTEAESHNFGSARVTVRDKSHRVADSRIIEDLEVDGVWLGDAIYIIRRNMGASEDELSLLPRGEASGWKLSTAPPGERAAFKPRKGTGRFQYASDDLVEKFGLGQQYFFDGNGRDRLQSPDSFAVEGVIYRPASNEASAGRRVYYGGSDGFSRSRTLDRYRTRISIQGAIDPDKKKRREWVFELAAAVDVENPNSPFFVGEHIPLEPIVDDAYTTDLDLEVVGRSLKQKWCRIPETWQCRVPYEDDVQPGAVFQFEMQGGHVVAWRVVDVTPDDDVSTDELTITLETPY